MRLSVDRALLINPIGWLTSGLATAGARTVYVFHPDRFRLSPNRPVFAESLDDRGHARRSAGSSPPKIYRSASYNRYYNSGRGVRTRTLPCTSVWTLMNYDKHIELLRILDLNFVIFILFFHFYTSESIDGPFTILPYAYYTKEFQISLMLQWHPTIVIVFLKFETILKMNTEIMRYLVQVHVHIFCGD